MLRGSITNVDYEDTQFVGSIGMMAREWGGELKQSEQTEFNRLRRTGGVFKNYVTEGDGLRQASASRMPVYYVSGARSEEHTSELQSLMRLSYDVFCLKKKTQSE